MKQFLDEIRIETKGAVEFLDITDRVASVLEKSGIRDGIATVFTQHTTAAIRINERCARLQADMLGILEKLVPRADYRHDEDTVDNRKNARSHLTALLLGASETIPVSNGKFMLGTWQSVFFIELDGPRHSRRAIVKIIGDN